MAMSKAKRSAAAKKAARTRKRRAAAAKAKRAAAAKKAARKRKRAAGLSLIHI